MERVARFAARLRLKSPRSALCLLAGGVILARLLVLWFTGATFEDAYISLRYAENLAGGLGLVYNAGERVFGASTPLYVLFLSGLVRLGVPALEVARPLGALLDGVTFILWGGWLLRQTGSLWAPTCFAVLFGLTGVVAQVAVGGMETPIALLLLSLVLLGYLERRLFLCGVALGLLALARPEGVLAGLVICGDYLRRERRVPWQVVVPAAVLVLPWLLGAWWYYGSPVPHSIPAKVAAYNLHRDGGKNFWPTLHYLAPVPGMWARWLATLFIFPCLLLGFHRALRRQPVLPVLLLAWWAYLVLPNTLLFPWYFPPLLLIGFLIAALGFHGWILSARLRGGAAAVLGVVALLLAIHTAWSSDSARSVQQAELEVRRSLGLWLREETPEEARIALEPIGYIGYYSRRRVLDAVGLVSPEMVPLNREGAGWFTRMVRAERPDYVVERPFYLLRNQTLNSHVPLFRTQEERVEFLAAYEPVAQFARQGPPQHLDRDYRFVVFRRRTEREAEARMDAWQHLSARRRADLVAKGLSGLTDEPQPLSVSQPPPAGAARTLPLP
jgi:hypothetical protein